MVNYYETLKVSQKASRNEIKSAYRRLARKLHPDKNNGSEQTATAFAAIAEAYEVLGNPKQRSAYDLRLSAIHASNGNGDSVFTSSNSHAQRWRQLIYEHRYNEIIDRMIAEERRESQALQKFLFPVVALFVSTLAVAIVRPNLFLSDYVGTFFRIIVVSFFVVGVIHIVGRVREAFDRFTYDDENIHESILDETELPSRQYSRYQMTAMLVGGIVICFGLGLTIGYVLELRSLTEPYLFSAFPQVDVLFFPPIFVLVVDAMHGFLLRSEI
jgi:curved DNA-binding protein CbpA